MAREKTGAGAERPRQLHRRRVLRNPLIVLRTKVETRRSVFFGYAKNISRGGMFIASVNPPEPGSRFELEFELPGQPWRRIHCSGEVVWNRSYSQRGPYEPGMGLRFTDLPDEPAQAIEDWVHAE
jgi:uncharacterized protein (TIGR02266 family)